MATVTTSPGRMRKHFIRILPGDDVAGEDADEVLAHLARDVGDDLVPIVELDAKLRVGKGLHHFALNHECFFFGHTNRFSGGNM